MSQRWCIASGFIILLLSGCGNTKSPQDIYKLTKASTILITAYTEQPSTGTGFFIEGEKGVCTVLTARHVVPVATKVLLQTNDGKPPWEPAKIQRFPNQDLAIVTFKPAGEDCPYPALKLGDSDKVAEGETIYITGFPGGSSTPQFVNGAVSAIAKLPDGYGISYPVATAVGMSGGSVVNSIGEVIAIHGRSESELNDKAKLKGENPPPQQQSTKSTNPPERVVQDTFKWGIPSNVYKKNLATAKSDTLTAKDFSNNGNDLLVSKKYEEAIASYDKALQFKPDFHEAWFYRGNALDDLQRYSEAITSYDKATQFKPNYHEAWNNRGNVLGKLKRYEEAIASFDKAIQIKPDDHEVWYNRGLPLIELKRYEEAIASYDKALQIKSDSYEAWTNRGIALGDLKRYEEAIASYDKALQIKPDSHEAWNGKGYALEQLQKYEEALKCYEKAISIQPDFQAAIDNRKELLTKLGRSE
jgi:tetratricopeptide (TPR) repeat protein